MLALCSVTLFYIHAKLLVTASLYKFASPATQHGLKQGTRTRRRLAGWRSIAASHSPRAICRLTCPKLQLSRALATLDKRLGNRFAGVLMLPHLPNQCCAEMHRRRSNTLKAIFGATCTCSGSGFGLRICQAHTSGAAGGIVTPRLLGQ